MILKIWKSLTCVWLEGSTGLGLGCTHFLGCSVLRGGGLGSSHMENILLRRGVHPVPSKTSGQGSTHSRSSRPSVELRCPRQGSNGGGGQGVAARGQGTAAARPRRASDQEQHEVEEVEKLTRGPHPHSHGTCATKQPNTCLDIGFLSPASTLECSFLPGLLAPCCAGASSGFSSSLFACPVPGRQAF